MHQTIRAPSLVAQRRICNWARANAVQSGQGPIFDLAAFKRIVLDVLTSSTVGAGEPSRSANASLKAALKNVPWQHRLNRVYGTCDKRNKRLKLDLMISDS